MAEAPKGTVTFLFTDIEGSTRLWEEHPDAMRIALARHDEIVRAAITENGGYVFATGGDGFAAAFERAGHAVLAAIAAQVALGAEPWTNPVTLSVRMGVHTGEVQEREGNYFGPPVNRAARLMGACGGGQVIVSALTAELLGQAMRAELVDLGPLLLKGVIEPVQVFGVSADGFDWVDRPLAAGQSLTGNLPLPSTEFVGSITDLRSLAARATSARLVTLTGSGGIGKSRSAVEIGWLAVDNFPDGVWIAELAPVADPSAVHASIAAVLGASPKAGVSAVESIADWCRGRHMLLIVDNCEHVLDPVMDLVSALTGCATVSVLATSREPLGLAGEQVVRVPSLEAADGVELFIGRAAAADSAFEPTEADLQAIAAICRRLDGIPLAIELAAARIRMLAPAEMLGRLDDRFRLLRGSGRGGMGRHQTLRATVNWSYQLLSEAERLLFDRLSVFAGGFDIAAVEAVCGRDGIDELEVIEVLGALIDRSMVIADRNDQVTRYRLLETLRQFGEERLDDRSETALRRDMHLGHYVETLGRLHAVVFSSRQVEADAIVDLEWHNARSAHEWAIATSDLGRAVSLLRSTSYHAAQRLRHDHADWTLQTMELGDRLGTPSAHVLQHAAFWAFVVGDLSQTMQLARRGLHDDPDDPMAALCRAWLAWALLSEGQLDDAAASIAALPAVLSGNPTPEIEFACRMVLIDVGAATRSIESEVEEFAARAAQTGAPGFLAVAERLRGDQELFSANPAGIENAISCYLRSIESSEAIGARETASWARLGLASAAVYSRSPRAGSRVRDALSEVYDARYWAAIPGILSTCALHLAWRGETEAPAVIVGYIDGHHGRQRVVNRAMAIAAIDATAETESYGEAGAAMADHEIVAYALARLGED